MNPSRSLRALGGELLAQLSEDERARLRQEPGQLFFPKTICEIGSSDPNVPGGSSPDYIRLASSKLREAIDCGKSRRFGSGFLSLLSDEIQLQVATALVLEQELLALAMRDEGEQ